MYKIPSFKVILWIDLFLDDFGRSLQGDDVARKIGEATAKDAVCLLWGFLIGEEFHKERV